MNQRDRCGTGTQALWMVLWISGAATAAALAPALPRAAETGGPVGTQDRAALGRTVRLELDAPSLAPPLERALPVLMEAALEGSEAMEVIPEPPEGHRGAPAAGAGWVLRLSVSGKGPWKMAAKVSPTGEDPRTAGAPRINGTRLSFSDLGQLITAVDTMAADLQNRWREAGVLTPQGAPAPLARSLSASPRAIERYVEAMHALRSASGIAEADRLLDEALKEDPRFGLASAQKAWLDRSRGARITPCASAEEGSVMTQRICHGLSLLASGEPARALQAAERIRQEAPQMAWGRVMAGMSLAPDGRSREALQGWRQVAAQEPEDPRARLWLGMAAMAAGQFEEAAGALASVRAAWPDLWMAYTLEAECHARLGRTQQATEVAVEMKKQMESRHVVPSSSAECPSLMIGSLQLMEGRFNKSLETFQAALDSLIQAGAPPEALRTLHETIVEMKRDLVTARDPITRDRELQDADAALERLETTLPASERDDRPWPLLRLRGLLQVKRGQTSDAWRTVERIRAHAERPGYTAYEEAYLSGVIMMKEGDYEGAVAQFQRAAQARGRLVDIMDLAQLQSRMKRYDDARANFEIIQDRLSRYEPNGEGKGELMVADPHLALLVPIYHFTWAQQGYSTGDATESRRQYGLMLRYFRAPELQFEPMVREALDRGANAP